MKHRFSCRASPMPASAATQILRIWQVQDRTGLSRTTIWRLERSNLFPKHRQISTRAVGWLERDVDEWIRSRNSIAK
jgi:prophage regulatory protein